MRIIFTSVLASLLVSVALSANLSPQSPYATNPVPSYVNANIIGKWVVEGDISVSVEFTSNGFSLFGCNSIGCSYTLTGTQFSASKSCVSTLKFCQVDNDGKYLKSLQDATKVKVQGQKINFLNAQGQVLIVLVRSSNQGSSNSGSNQAQPLDYNGNRGSTQYYVPGNYYGQNFPLSSACQIGQPSLIGDWVVQGAINGQTISITFSREGFSLFGCNTNSCRYTLQANNFSTDGNCASTRRFCFIDDDRLYIGNLQSANTVVVIGNFAYFFDKSGALVITLARRTNRP